MTQTEEKKTQKIMESIWQFLPMEEIDDIARVHKADGHAQVLKTRILVTSVLFSMITCRRLSQRGIEDSLSSPEYRDFVKLETEQNVSHQAISKRLKHIPVKLSESIFQKAYLNMKHLIDNDFYGYNLVRIDASTVSEVATKLCEGIVTGSKPKDTDKDRKKSLKYTLATTQWEPLMAEILSQQRFLSDDCALMEVIRPMVKEDPDHHNLYVIDRGLKGKSNIDEFGKDRIHFVLRLHKDRMYTATKDLPVEPPKGKGDVEIISDQMVRLATNPKYEFRLVKYKPLPKDPSDSEEYETIWVLTDELTLSAQEIASAYKKRWDIEVLIKYLKQNLFLSHFTSVSPNGLAFMLYMTMLSALLVGMVCRSEKVKYTAALFLIAQALYQLGKELVASLTKEEFLKKIYSMNISLTPEQKQSLEKWDPKELLSKGCH